MAKTKKPLNPDVRNVHSWRTCPYGQHWVQTHALHVPPSKRHPSGSVTTRHGHCADNPTKKDQLYPDEIHEIAERFFSSVKNKPCPLSLTFKNGNKYDPLIAGWVQYWNEVLQPDESLDPNLVKALIATESSFQSELLANPKNSNSARGLMQITNETRKILGNSKGEINEHYLTVTKLELNDPGTNICAGVRWLFHKRVLTSSRLKRQATWLETIEDYKGTRVKSNTTKRTQELIGRVIKRFEELKACGKKA
jgi:hypothetical protein